MSRARTDSRSRQIHPFPPNNPLLKSALSESPVRLGGLWRVCWNGMVEMFTQSLHSLNMIDRNNDGEKLFLSCITLIFRRLLGIFN